MVSSTTIKLFSYFDRPKENHPAFYGCFDWQSSVHGHWLLATVARRYPNSELADNVTAVFKEQFRVMFYISFTVIEIYDVYKYCLLDNSLYTQDIYTFYRKTKF